MAEQVDYDTLAAIYDQRYERDEYEGVEQALMDFVGNDVTRRILDVGCGTGHWLDRLVQRGYTGLAGLDRSPRMLARAEARATGADLRLGYAQDLPWPTGTFDRIICVNALHHFSDKASFIVEARRVLRGDGGLITLGLDPHVGSDRWVVYDFFEGTLEADKRRYLPTAVIRKLMTTGGFTHADTFVAMHRPLVMPADAALAGGHLDKNATSQLILLSDDAYQAGVARIRRQISEAEERGKTFEIGVDLRVYATVSRVA